MLNVPGGRADLDLGFLERGVTVARLDDGLDLGIE
jgi:hypothetical protein